MKFQQIEDLFGRFLTHAKLIEFTELKSGHINDTYLLITARKPYYILQKINHLVFKNIDDLMNNKVLISNHIIKKQAKTKNPNYTTTQFFRAKGTNLYYIHEEGSFWNLSLYIDDTISYEKVENEKIAFEAGKIIGDFTNLSSDFDPERLIEIIPGFHNMANRLTQFDDAVKHASKARYAEAKREVEQVNILRNEMLVLHTLRTKKKIPIRVTHNDTKISNILFDKDNNGKSVIDLDTVMPGIVHYDFGDAIRSVCSTADEDEKDLSKVTFNIDYFTAFTKGFIITVKEVITDFEKELLALSPKVMTFIMAVRMLTDFLNNDIYYKTNYELHNLIRAKNQLKLVFDMKSKEKLMESIVLENWKS